MSGFIIEICLGVSECLSLVEWPSVPTHNIPACLIPEINNIFWLMCVQTYIGDKL